MSAPKLPLALTARARADLRDIEAYTLARWDERQWESYEAALAQALTAIADNPEIGRARDEIRPGYRSYVVGQHLIFYRLTPRAVVVIGILPARKDLRRALRSRR
jgi:toxin ParE1/3/4